jgi:orotidine-5'-phosphate decarboxylase
MEKLFCDRLAEVVQQKKSCLMLGLDPNTEKMPDHFEATPAGIEQFCKEAVDAVEDLICGIKIQMAYFEIFGSEGIAVVERLLKYCKEKGLITMVDGKRNDIGATSAAYAKAYLAPGAPMEADCMTVNPLLGTDGITPFLPYCENNGKGIFILVRTSNPSSKEFQGYEDVCVRIAEKVEDWNISTQSGTTNLASVGAVVGATHSGMVKFFREEMPHAWILAPGVGAQGGKIEAVLEAQKNGLGVLIPVSRAVLYADKSKNWALAGRKVMEELFLAQTVA